MNDHAINGKIGAAERWARTTAEQRQEATAPARSAWAKRFERLALEANPDLTGADLIAAADRLKQAHMLRMAKASAKARRRKTAA